jgi:hypothetical protein
MTSQLPIVTTLTNLQLNINSRNNFDSIDDVATDSASPAGGTGGARLGHGRNDARSDPPQLSTSISVKTRRSSLPVALRGSSSINTTSRGTLWRAKLFLT